MNLRTEFASSEISEFNLTSGLDVAIGWIERLGVWVESALETRPWLSMLVLATVYLAGTSVRALRRPLWFDEILTRYIAALPSFDAIYKALAAHTESSPPLFHLVSKLSANTLGWNGLGLRFPAMAGYLAMMICVYFIVSRYAGSLYGAIAALSTYITNAPFYETEARPYGLLLGLSSVALVCWQMAARDRARWLALAGLWLCLTTALGIHYYAVLSFAAIGLGELVRTWRARHIDWPVWAALGLATAPLPLLLPLIRSNFVLKQGYFAPATMSRLVNSFMHIYMHTGGLMFAAFVILTGACIVVFSGRQMQPAEGFDSPPVYEVVAWTAFLLAPVEAFVIGRFVTGVFVPRYAIVSIIGLSILLPVWLRRFFRGSRGAALIVLLFVGLCFGTRCARGFKPDDPNSDLALWLHALNRSRVPIVVADQLTYLPLAYRADRELSETLVYIPDPQEAFKYRGVNSGDYNLAGLRAIAPLNLPTYSSFASSQRQFLVLWEPSPYGWIVRKLRDAGAELQFCAASDERVLFLVDLPATGILPEDRSSKLTVDMVCNYRKK